MRVLAASSVFLALLAGGPAGHTQNATDALSILAGKTVRFVVTGNPGSGTDRYARAFITAFEATLPDTRVLVQNAEGGGGAVALIEAQTVRGDTISVVATHTTPVFTQMLGNELSAAFDLTEFHWIGALANNQRMVVVRASLGEPSVGHLAALGRPLVAPIAVARTISEVELRVLDAMTDLEIEIVPGMDDTLRDSLLLAGTADLAAGSYLELKPLLDAGTVVPLVRLGIDGYPPEVAAVPSLDDLARPGSSAVVVGILDTLNRLGRMFVAAPQTDPAIVEALRVAFDRTVAAPSLAETFAASNLLLAPTDGAALAAGIGILLGDEDAKALLERYLDCSMRLAAEESACLAP